MNVKIGNKACLAVSFLGIYVSNFRYCVHLLHDSLLEIYVHQIIHNLPSVLLYFCL
jgi:hypothetical protein